MGEGQPWEEQKRGSAGGVWNHCKTMSHTHEQNKAKPKNSQTNKQKQNKNKTFTHTHTHTHTIANTQTNREGDRERWYTDVLYDTSTAKKTEKCGQRGYKEVSQSRVFYWKRAKK